MDNYENMDREEELRQEHTEQTAQVREEEQPAGQYYANAGVGRKESPYPNPESRARQPALFLRKGHCSFHR